MKSLSCVRLFAIPWPIAYQAPLSMGFSRQWPWSGLPFPSPADLPDPGIGPRSPALQADALLSEPPGKLYISIWGQNSQVNMPVDVVNTVHQTTQMAISRGKKVESLSPVLLFATPWTAAYQAHPSMGFSRQEYWSGLPLPSPKWNIIQQ